MMRCKAVGMMMALNKSAIIAVTTGPDTLLRADSVVVPRRCSVLLRIFKLAALRQYHLQVDASVGGAAALALIKGDEHA